MTTPAEKVALDVIFKALESGFPDPSQRLNIVVGFVAHYCAEHGVPLQLAEELLKNRFHEYQSMFGKEVFGEARKHS